MMREAGWSPTGGRDRRSRFLVITTAVVITLSALPAQPAWAVASQLGITTPAAGFASGAAFTTQPIVKIQDSVGATETGSTASVTASVSAGAELVGTTSVTASSGVATFSGLGITGTLGTAYTITFASTGLTSASQTATVTLGAASRLSILTAAGGAVSGTAFTTQPVVRIVDLGGNIVTSSTATVTATTSGGASLVGTGTAVAVAGVATFSNLGLTGTSGTRYPLAFAATSLTGITETVLVTGASSTLTLTTAAAGFSSGTAFTTQPVLAVRDSSGNTVVGSTATVTASVSSGGTLIGTTTAQAVSGIASFTNLGLTGTSGTAYTITFSASGLTSATASVTLGLGIAAKLAIGTSGTGAVSGSALTTQPVILVQDSGGSTVTSASSIVTASVSAGATLTGVVAVAAVAGVARFSNLGVTGPASTYTLTFFTSGLTAASQSVAVSTTVVPPSVALTSVTPMTGPTTGGTTVIITGSNLTIVTSVKFDQSSAAAITVLSSTSLSVITPAHAAGPVAVTVSGVSSSASLPNAFTCIAASTGKSLGGGVTLATTGQSNSASTTSPVNARTSQSTATGVRVKTKKRVAIRVKGLPKSSTMSVRIKIKGSWESMGQVSSNGSGRGRLRALTFTKKGTFVVRVTKGKKKYYLKAVARN